MPLPLRRAAVALALAASVGLVTLPACKKKKPTQPDTPNVNEAPQPRPAPGQPPTGGTDARDPSAPRSPVFGTSDPRTAAMRAEAQGNVKQIVLGLQLYHDAYQTLPGGYADKGGKPGLSWRVAILPFIEQGALFEQFKLDEPWDSPANKALIPKMPKVFAPPRTETNGYTFVRGFTGPGTWLPPQSQTGQAGQPLRGVSFSSIPDGTTNTILVAEAYEPVIWTKPDEVPFTPGSAPRLGGVFASGFVAGLADGSVQFVRPSISPKALASAIQVNDGGIVNWDE